MVNVTFSGNSASSGGGIYNNTSAAWTLTNVTLSGNSATDGGGIYHHSAFSSANTVTLKNTIVANSPSGGNCYQAGSSSNIGSNGFNLSDDTSCGLTSTGDRQGPNFNPQLGQLQNNGGSTQTQLPQAGSPAIDNGTGNGTPARDQRGYIRAGAAPDIGAAEFGGTIPVTLANISTRLFVQTADNVLIGGFIITGTQPKKVILRAIGPSLSLPGKLADPTLELYQGQTLLEGNDNWVDSPNKQAIMDSTIPPSDPLESAIVRSLAPGPYTAVLRGANNGTGIGVVEAYDLDRTVDSKLANISTRAFVSTGSDIVIAGFILGGNSGNDNVIVRGIGPSLTAFGVPNALANPTLDLRDSNGALIQSNNDWQDDPAQAELISAAGLAPTNALESAIAATLAPGQYTALLAGLSNGTGVGLVEVLNSTVRRQVLGLEEVSHEKSCSGFSQNTISGASLSSSSLTPTKKLLAFSVGCM